MNCISAARRIAVAAAFAAFPAAAGAQMPSGMGSNCMMDQLTQACPDAKPGTPEFSACSKQHVGDAMAACQSQAQASGAAQPRTTSARACADQMHKFCPGMWPGTPEFIKCMNGHEGDMTSDCRAAYEKRKAEHKSADTTCVADSKKYCPGLTVLDHMKYMACMRKNYDSLSPKCQAQFKDLHAMDKGPHAECMAAVQKFCPDAAPGSPEMTQCMMAHHDELPASCRN
jgi:hypothetical protein